MSSELSKEVFIQTELRQFAEYLATRAKAAIVRRRINVDGDLLRSLAVRASENEVDMLFDTHGRFHDMGAGRGFHKGVPVSREARMGVLKPHKPSLWYSRLSRGAVMGTLVNNLMNKYIETVSAGLKADLAAA